MLYLAVISYKNSKKTLKFVHEAWKTLLWADFGPFWPQNPSAKYFLKDPVLPVSELADTLTSCKKAENLQKLLRIKPCGKYTNRQINGQDKTEQPTNKQKDK